MYKKFSILKLCYKNECKCKSSLIAFGCLAYIELNKILTLILPTSFRFFSVGSWVSKITYVAHLIFLLDSEGPVQKSSRIWRTGIPFSYLDESFLFSYNFFPKTTLSRKCSATHDLFQLLLFSWYVLVPQNQAMRRNGYTGDAQKTTKKWKEVISLHCRSLPYACISQRSLKMARERSSRRTILRRKCVLWRPLL